MLIKNTRNISFTLSLIVLVAIFGFLAHHVIGQSVAYGFCLLSLCAFILTSFVLIHSTRQFFIENPYGTNQGNDIPSPLERPPRF